MSLCLCGSLFTKFPTQLGIGLTADVWAGLRNRNGNIGLSNVYGVDSGMSIGSFSISTLGLSGGITGLTATPANEVVDSALDKLGIKDTSVGRAYSKYAEKVSHVQLNGFGLFMYRLSNGCGRYDAK